MSAPVIPAGGTIVDTFKQSFVDVPIDAENGNAIATTPFLDAAESLTTMFGKKHSPLHASDGFNSRRETFVANLGLWQMSWAPSPSLPSRATCSATSR